MTIPRGEGCRDAPTRQVGGRTGSPMDRRVAASCQTDVRSRRRFSKTWLGGRVLGRPRVGRVQRGAEGGTVGPRETDPALVQPGLPPLLGQALRLGVGKRERLELLPSERLDLRLRVGDPWQRRWLLSLRGGGRGPLGAAVSQQWPEDLAGDLTQRAGATEAARHRPVSATRRNLTKPDKSRARDNPEPSGGIGGNPRSRMDKAVERTGATGLEPATSGVTVLSILGLGRSAVAVALGTKPNSEAGMLGAGPRASA